MMAQIIRPEEDPEAVTYELELQENTYYTQYFSTIGIITLFL